MGITKSVSKKNTKELIPFSDVKTGQIYFFEKKDLEKELKNIYDKISDVLAKIEKLGKYELESVEISAGVSGSIFVLTANGGITLRYSVPKTG